MEQLAQKIEKTRIYRHADDGKGAKVFYVMSLDEFHTSKTNMNLSFERMENEIYHDSTFTKVITPPAVTTLRFDIYESMQFFGLLVEASSTYMATVRERLYMGTSLFHDMTLKNCKYDIKLGAINKKVSQAGLGRNSERLILTVVEKETGLDVICVKIKKTKIQFLLNMYKTLIDEYAEKIAFPYDDMHGRRVLFVRSGDFIAIGDVWLHGREIQKLQDYIERSIFDFKYAARNGNELFRYRQIEASFSEIESVAKICLTKFTEKHIPWKNEDDGISQMEFLVSSGLLARLYMLLPKFIGFDSSDKEICQTADEGPVVIKDFGYYSSLNEGDFILNAIESQLALSVIRDQKFSAKDRYGKMLLQARYRDAIIEDDNHKVGYTSTVTNSLVYVPKLTSVELDLRIDWLYIFALCAESVHSSADIDVNEHGNYAHSWSFVKKRAMGSEKHTIRVVVDPGNKAPAVLLIDKLEENYDGDETYIEKRMRIPLFREHIRTIIKGVIGLSRLYENYYWQKSFPVYSDESDNVRGDMRLGLRRFIGKKGLEVVSMGLVGQSEDQIMLTESDRDTLFISAYNRLMFGRWLQFSGEKIAISFDGYLTDRFNEYKIEFDMENSSGARGSLAALAIVFSTVRTNFTGSGNV